MSPLNQPDPRSKKELFFAALDISALAERALFLDRVCGGDSEKRRRLDELLTNHFGEDGFMREPAAIDSGDKPIFISSADEGAGTFVGRYHLLEKLGEGGFGVVWVAEQNEPVKRRVALKIIKLGMDTRAVVARFEAERQALALMDHPNIARIFDGGATETGSPYFVMELIQGLPLNKYCDANQLTVPDRIRLFIQVCEAVQSAHQKGIIHRDLKPSNVLVTAGPDPAGIPKVIDFGIAKATEGRLTDSTIHSQFHQFIGTPAYMSPEQAEMSGLDIDTRSDIYSLGVLLYELLTGSTPFDAKKLMESSVDAMRKTIREQEPMRPSTRLSQTQSGRLRWTKETITLLQGDLDWIVLKCLEKDRTRRYETANGLAADLKRHLNNEPILARPPSAIYKIQKFVRRNRAGTIAAATIFLGVIALFIFGYISYQRERAARTAADKSQSAEFLQRQRALSEAARAKVEATRARQFQYASDMTLAQQAVTDGNFFRALRLLNRHRPNSNRGNEPQTHSGKDLQSRLASSSLEDLRGWEWRYLWKQCQGQQRSILGSHSNGVTAVGFLPGGKIAFSAGKDNAVRLWDLETKASAGVLLQTASVTGAICSPDGRWMATTIENRNNPLIIWDLTNHQATQQVITNQWLRPNSLAFSPDSQLLAFSELYTGVHVWSFAAGKVIAQLPAYHHWLGPLGLAFSPDSQTLAYTENEGGDIVLWSVHDQAVIRRLKGHTWCVTALAFMPDGQLLVSGSGDRTVKLWDVASGAERITFAKYNDGVGALDVSSMRLSPDGRMLATAASGGGMRITVQEVPSGREITQLRGHQDLVTDGAFSPDGRTFLSGSLDGTVRLWDLTPSVKETGSPDVAKFPSDCDEFFGGSSLACSLAPDGRHLLTIFTNRTFSVWEIPELRESSRHPLPMNRAESAALATDGQLAAFVAEDGNVMFWRGDTGETHWFAWPTTDKMSRAAFSPDGKLFAIGGPLGVSVCDVPSGKRLFTFPIGKSGKYSEGDFDFALAFSPDSQKLLAGFGSGVVKMWDLIDSGRETAFRGHDFQVNGLALSTDGKTLVSAAREIRFWDLNSSGTRLVLNPRSAVFRCVAISADGGRLAAGGNDGPITIWDLASKQEVATLVGHTRPLLALSFLSDGSTLVSIGVDQIRIWRAATLQEADAKSDSR